jgi:uncharacterized protein YceK
VAGAHQGRREPGNGVGRFHNKGTKSPRRATRKDPSLLPRGPSQGRFAAEVVEVRLHLVRQRPRDVVGRNLTRFPNGQVGLARAGSVVILGPFQGGGEMGVRALSVTLLLSILATGGCGTVANLAKPGPEAGGKSPFGGVSHDMACIRDASNEVPNARAHDQPESDQLHRGALVLLYAADLPLSFLGDVVTWPYVVAYTCINQPVPTPPVLLAPAVAPPLPPPSLPAPPPEPLPKPTKLP